MVEIVDVLEALATMQETLVLRSLSCDTDLKTPCVTHQKKEALQFLRIDP